MSFRGETGDRFFCRCGVSSAVPSASAAKIIWDVVLLYATTFLSTSIAGTFPVGDFHGGLT